MQSLPDIPADAPQRGDRDAISTRPRRIFSAAEQAEIARQVLAILNDLMFAEVFAPGSRAEVPIVGRIARDRRAAGCGVRPGGPAGGDAAMPC